MRDRLIRPFGKTALRLFGVAALAGLLAGCQADELAYGAKHGRGLNGEIKATMAKAGMSESAPVLMRIFKEENAFEVWKKDRSGRYQLLKTYEICKWSGGLGPKLKEGDRQAPEGYYSITPGLMNPNSQYHLAFNTGFPNAYDRANGRTGTALMVHGACSSRGCYAMTDAQIQEIYTLARDAFKGGQASFQLAAYPFRMTPENMGRHWNNPNMPFWKMLKEGYDTFELTRQEPKVDVCGRKYVFNATPKGSMSPAAACPELVQPETLKVALRKKAAEDEAKAIVVAARVEVERKKEEERLIAIAQAKEAARIHVAEEQRKAEERRIMLAQRPDLKLPDVIAMVSPITLFGGAEAPAEPATAAEALETAARPAAADGSPVPRPDPRRPAATALALAEPEAPADGGSMFSRLLSFGSSKPADPQPPVDVTTTASIDTAAAPSATVTAAPAAVVQPPASATVTPVTPAPPVAAASKTAPQGAAPAATAACVAPGTAATAGTPTCPLPTPVAAAEPAPGPDGLISRIGSWF